MLHDQGDRRLVELVPVRSSEASAIIESDPLSFDQTRRVMDGLLRARDTKEVCSVLADEVRRVTGFNRVVVYRFEPNWDGVIDAESRDELLDSFLGMRFPAADIPSQARDLFARVVVRAIHDSHDTGSPLRHVGGDPCDPLDQSDAMLRAPSPVHTEYLRNMGVRASVTVAIRRSDGQLWGLVAGHHASARWTDAATRAWCRLVGDLAGVQIAARIDEQTRKTVADIEALRGPLIQAMGPRGGVADGISAVLPEIISCLGADGGAFVDPDHVAMHGHAPPEVGAIEFATWVRDQHPEDIWTTRHLGSTAPIDGNAFAGVLVIDLGSAAVGSILLFRHEVAEDVSWAGAEQAIHSARSSTLKRLEPRGSFAVWRTQLQGHSREWAPDVMRGARRLRIMLVDQILIESRNRVAALEEDVLDQTRELRSRNEALREFTYVASHDLQEPIRKILSFCDLLIDDLGEDLSAAAAEDVEYIVDGARRMSRLISDLLALSRAGRDGVVFDRVDMNDVIDEAVGNVSQLIESKEVRIVRPDVPVVHADRTMLVQLYQNLIANAAKFSDRQNTEVRCTMDLVDGEVVFGVKDQGIGFDPTFAEQIFGTFRRLHTKEEYPGSGVGLSICRRVVEVHGGRIWAETDGEGTGAWFRFVLGNRIPSDEKSADSSTRASRDGGGEMSDGGGPGDEMAMDP
ncbi:MAG: ATP-binding protein [Phycisphaerales bacterium]